VSTAWITRGLPASGKSTWAREYIATSSYATVRLNRDDLRLMALPEDYWTTNPTSERVSERAITAIQHAALKALLADGYDVVCDDTNLHERYFQRLVEAAEDAGVMVEIVDLRDVPLEECIRRDAQRTGREHVGEQIIREMHDKHILTASERILQVAHRIADRPGYEANPRAGVDDAGCVL